MTTIADVLEGRERWCVVHGDNADVLPALADKCVASVITDPPYEAEAHTLQRRVKNGERTSEWRGRTVDVLNPSLSFAPISDEQRRLAAAQIARLAQRWAVAFCQVEAAVSWRDALVAGGHAARRIGVWVKPDAMPQFTGDRPGMGYESIVFTHTKGRSKWNGGGRVGVFTHNKNSPGGAHAHETMKPLQLMIELVELFTDPDDLVLDPYCGSGTTGLACVRLGRRFIGIERDEKYADVARQRIAGIYVPERNGQASLFAP